MKKWIISALFITAGLVASYYELKPGHFFPSDHNTSTQLSFYLNNIESRSFNEEGSLTQILTTQKASQNTASNQITMNAVNLKIGQGNKRWTISANTGSTDSQLQQVTLQDSIKLTSGDGTTEVYTEELVLDGEKEIAYTDLPIKILVNGSETTATGLHVDLKQETIHLKHNVKTYYDPKNNNSGNARSNG